MFTLRTSCRRRTSSCRSESSSLLSTLFIGRGGLCIIPTSLSQCRSRFEGRINTSSFLPLLVSLTLFDLSTRLYVLNDSFLNFKFDLECMLPFLKFFSQICRFQFPFSFRHPGFGLNNCNVSEPNPNEQRRRVSEINKIVERDESHLCREAVFSIY